MAEAQGILYESHSCTKLIGKSGVLHIFRVSADAQLMLEKITSQGITSVPRRH